MRKVIPIALTGTAAVAVPLAIVLAGHQSAGTSAAATPTTAPAPAQTTAPRPIGPAAPAAGRTYIGPSVDMQWGPVQVTIVVKGASVTDLSASAPTERPRSAFINQQAVPMLRQEVLQAGTVANIKNIYGISGATMTSEAFYQSLLAALASAHLT